MEALVTMPDALTCRARSACAACEHWRGARGCALEADLEEALVALALVERPAPPAALRLVDVRHAAVTSASA